MTEWYHTGAGSNYGHAGAGRYMDCFGLDTPPARGMTYIIYAWYDGLYAYAIKDIYTPHKKIPHAFQHAAIPLLV